MWQMEYQVYDDVIFLQFYLLAAAVLFQTGMVIERYCRKTQMMEKYLLL
jgi:hypothetical protein